MVESGLEQTLGEASGSPQALSSRAISRSQPSSSKSQSGKLGNPFRTIVDEKAIREHGKVQSILRWLTSSPLAPRKLEILEFANRAATPPSVADLVIFKRMRYPHQRFPIRRYYHIQHEQSKELKSMHLHDAPDQMTPPEHCGLCSSKFLRASCSRILLKPQHGNVEDADCSTIGNDRTKKRGKCVQGKGIRSAAGQSENSGKRVAQLKINIVKYQRTYRHIWSC